MDFKFCPSVTSEIGGEGENADGLGGFLIGIFFVFFTGGAISLSRDLNAIG